jgi:GAF domain-containing protein
MSRKDDQGSTRVTWTEDERELLRALGRLYRGASTRKLLGEALRALYRTTTLIPWRRGAPTSYEGARRERSARVRAPGGTSVLDADVLEELDASPDVATLGARRTG